ncbi:DUF2793 domain-containing protein [Ochrobactrum sp. Marseille-Q0166]|uniref:DUF2793 domain-containing protein n=1 Tax=Ochrobactrum sp. Marseille-Q0166 TaxID=2761105 RepID=UPI0016563BE8|nr:DUF2793 domain-containing protein [Ochrobactrum sp. Marseille-Q0166]MBC8717878.1 DUF2793 domain-containing protein [Ochrobactrum sp. Marseille-Q0166]
MDQTPNLKLPYIMPSQAQKHVTHNEALRFLDAVVHLSVKSRTQTGAPETPAAGDRYIVAEPATGRWAGKEGLIAFFIDGGWSFATIAKGWLAYVEDEAKLFVFNGVEWQMTGSVPDSLSLAMLGIQTAADAINRFAISSEASLFNNAGAGHQLKINKQDAGYTASLLFQSGWTGHAEMGLNGDNNFSIKVGDESGNWREAMKVDRTTGNVAVGQIWPETRLHVDGPIRPAAYAVATLPSPSQHGAGAIVFVSNATGGAQVAYSDGAAWRSVRTGSVIT